MHFIALFYIVPLLQENAQSIRVLEGQSVTLRCIPTPDTLTVGWIFNGDNLYESEKFTFSPQNLNHTLSITNPGVEDMGLYTCYLNSFQTISKNITLEVEEGTVRICVHTLYSTVIMISKF